jgi:hypothetical protein
MIDWHGVHAAPRKRRGRRGIGTSIAANLAKYLDEHRQGCPFVFLHPVVFGSTSISIRVA